jgi:hypothetical protein
VNFRTTVTYCWRMKVRTDRSGGSGGGAIMNRRMPLLASAPARNLRRLFVLRAAWTTTGSVKSEQFFTPLILFSSHPDTLNV